MDELILIAALAGERVAFRASDVRSVIEIETIAPVPCAPPFVAGMAALRSRPLTVIDCEKSLELPTASAGTTDKKKAIIVEIDRHLYALLVDAIDDVIAVNAELGPPPTSLVGGWQRIALAMVETADDAVLLIDPAALITGPKKREAA